MDDIRAVMDAAGSERASLLGLSEGGPLALLSAATYPHRVRRIVLANSYARRFRDDIPRLAVPVRDHWGTGGVHTAEVERVAAAAAPDEVWSPAPSATWWPAPGCGS